MPKAEYNHNRKYIPQCNGYIHGFTLNTIIIGNTYYNAMNIFMASG